MSNASSNDSQRDFHRDFDGHLNKPLKDMTPTERVEWAWQGILLLHWAREEVRPAKAKD